MLVLSRKCSQRLVIGTDIRITVVGLEGNRVRLGIEAPAEVPVVRGELSARGREPRRAARAEPDAPAS